MERPETYSLIQNHQQSGREMYLLIFDHEFSHTAWNLHGSDRRSL